MSLLQFYFTNFQIDKTSVILVNVPHVYYMWCGFDIINISFTHL